jgi:hypothetical protein
MACSSYDYLAALGRAAVQKMEKILILLHGALG